MLATNQGMTKLNIQFKAHCIDDRREKIIRWLSTTDPSTNHHAACKKLLPTTGDWFVHGDDFREWKQAQNSLLWLYGIRESLPTLYEESVLMPIKAGCGKTILR